MQEYHRYPLVMKHPSHRPATIRHTVASTNLPPDAAQQFQHKVGATPQVGPDSPEMFPDVIVRTEDDENYYVSRGYVPAGGANPAGARTVQAAPLPPGFQAQQYPQAIGDRVVNDPNAKVVRPGEYPKYLRDLDVIAEDEEHENRLRGAAVTRSDARFETVPEMVEAMTNASKSSRRAVKRHVIKERDPERAELLRMARDLGLKPFNGWSKDKLRRMIEEATAPAAAD